MRTKTLILTAMIGAASVVASLAQTSNAVYSVNVVGYVTLTINNTPPLYRIISNPLIATNSHLSVLIPSAPDGSQVSKLVGTSYQTATFDSLSGGWDNDLDIPTGTGAFIILSPGASPLTVTFVGEVAQGAASNKQLPPGLSLQGSLVPQEGSIISVLQIPGEDGDQVQKLTAAGGYQTATFDSLGGGWDNDLILGVAEGFFFTRQGATSLPWNRNFTVPQ